MTSLAEQLIEMGEKMGFERGIELGIEMGQCEMLLWQLQQRFGPLPPEAAQRISRAGLSDLERWARRVLTAPTLDDVLDVVP